MMWRRASLLGCSKGVFLLYFENMGSLSNTAGIFSESMILLILERFSDGNILKVMIWVGS